MAANAGNDGVLDKFNRVSGARVLGFAVVVVIGNSRVRVEADVFEDTAEAESVPDLRFVLLRELDALGIAPAFEIEDAVGAPPVLVVADEIARRIGGERGLARPRESE